MVVVRQPGHVLHLRLGVVGGVGFVKLVDAQRVFPGRVIEMPSIMIGPVARLMSNVAAGSRVWAWIAADRQRPIAAGNRRRIVIMAR
jgi:hypothetical protein